MGWLTRKSKKNKAGSPTQSCPLGTINVLVSEQATSAGVSGAKISLSGTAKKSGKTNKNGYSQFKSLQAGSYRVEVTLPKKKKGVKISPYIPSINLGLGQTQQLQLQVSTHGNLVVNLVDDTGAVVTADYILNGPESIAQQKVTGKHPFENICVGDYRIRANIKENTYAKSQVEQTATVTQGETTRVELRVSRVNKVRPVVEIDNSVVKYFPDHINDANDPQLLEKESKANPPRKLIYYVEHSLPAIEYAGQGSLKITGNVLKVFHDEACKQPVSLTAGGTLVIPNDKTQHQVKSTLWLKGKADGIAQIGFVLDESDDERIVVERGNRVNLKVNEANFVQPKLAVEYLAVPLDRELARFRPNDTQVAQTEAVYAELSLIQSNTKYAYTKGARLSLNPANIKVYSDEKCLQEFDLSKTIPATLLTGQKPLQLWLKGSQKGKFELKLTLEGPAEPRIVLDAPAVVKMACVELEMKVHQQDIDALKQIQIDPDTGSISDYHTALKDKVLPEQKLMSDEEKVKYGRLLHVQAYSDTSLNYHGRAKLLLPKLNAAEWPDNTDDYQLYINRANFAGAVKLFDKEVEGTEIKLPAGPFTVKSLQQAEKVLWVEGAKSSTKDKNVRLDLSLDRPEGGLSKEVKRNADWGHFNIVKIKEVLLDYETPKDGSPNAFEKDKKRFFINFKENDDGRKIKIKAKLDSELKDVCIHVMLAEEKNNRKAANWGVDMPENKNVTGGTTVPNGVQNWVWKDIDKSLKHKDKEDRKHLLHLSKKTDDKGEVSIEVMLSRFGGDKFYLAAYIDQDPHLAKFIDGHTDLEKRKPVMAKDTLQVWRKFWYQLVEVQGVTVKDVMSAPNAYEKVKTIMAEGDKTTMPRAQANRVSPRVFYPKHMVSYYYDSGANRNRNNYPNDNADGLVVGDANQKVFFDLVTKKVKEPVAKPMINVHALWIKGAVSGDLVINLDAGFELRHFPRNLSFDTECLDPPLQGGTLFHSGSYTTYKLNPANNLWVVDKRGSFSSGDLSLDPNRSGGNQVKVALPAAIQGDPPTNRISLRLKINGAQSFLGTSYKDSIVVNSYTPNDEQDYVNTINHELGHSLSQVPVPTAGLRPKNPMHDKGIPAHPLHYENQGPHCDYQNKSCLMYESGPQPNSLNEYCPVCHPYVLVQDMTKM